MRGRRFSRETKPSRRVLTQSPSLVLIHQRFECSPSTSAELTPELMVTGRSCMKEAGDPETPEGADEEAEAPADEEYDEEEEEEEEATSQVMMSRAQSSHSTHS